MRARLPHTLETMGKYLLMVYAVGSMMYTITYFYPVYSGPQHDTSGIRPREAFDEPLHQAVIHREPLGSDYGKVSWSNAHGAIEPLSEHFLMSKLFSDTMGPSKRTPFFYRAKETFDQEDITMATLVTHSRFNVLSRLATNYRGPISAAVHITDDETKDAVIRELRETYAQNPDMQAYVDIHLIVDQFDRQFNMWRNVARLFARTDYVMMLDVDFHLCTNLRDSIRSNPEAMAKLRDEKAALVVPAFEFEAQEDGIDWRTFPTTKTQLLQLVSDGKIDMFHKAWTVGHGATNYSHWYTLTDATELYKVTDYHFSYEPYIVYKKDSAPWCDERFVGYGANKAACLYEIYLSGIDYWVLPHDFLIHQTHEYPEETRRKERQYNRKLYSSFREEMCFRYARKFFITDEWNTPVADNLKQQCDLIRGFRTALSNP